MKYLLVAALAATAAAMDCLAKELAPYNFGAIKGTYTDTHTKNTPPSTSVMSWSIGVCQNLDSLEDCPRNSVLCGTTRVKVDNKDLLTEAIGFNSNIKPEYTPFSGDDSSNEAGIEVAYKGVNWGDLLVDGTVRFICATKGDKDENKLKILKWTGLAFEGEFRTPAACALGSHKKPDSPGDNAESWGWFTWIFIFLVLFLSIYIIGGAWFQYNKGNLIDFLSALKEVLENFIDILKGLPLFVKEIVEKITGNSNRGEYSAV